MRSYGRNPSWATDDWVTKFRVRVRVRVRTGISVRYRKRYFHRPVGLLPSYFVLEMTCNWAFGNKFLAFCLKNVNTDIFISDAGKGQ